MNQQWQFFFHHAGWSYLSGAQSEIVGRLLGAVKLAEAEAWARANGCWFVWEDDPELADYQEEDGSWHQMPAVECVMYQHAAEPGEEPVLLQSLSSIMESEDDAERRNYRRVVEAELALEAMPS